MSKEDDEIWERSGINREFEENIPITGYPASYFRYPGRVKPKWWSIEVAELRSKCIALRRKYTHYRRRVHREEAEELQRYTAFREAKDLLNIAIANSKEKLKEKEQAGPSGNP